MLFVNPSLDPKTQPQEFNPFINTSFPTAIGYLAGYIREKQKDKVVIHDEQISILEEESLCELMKSVTDQKIVGLTCLTGTAKRAYEITRLIKRIDPEFVVVLGGIHATALPDEVLTKSATDIVVRGEGEETLSAIYEAVRDGQHLKDIAGISYKDNGNIRHNPSRELIADLSLIPPFPYDLFANRIDVYKDFGTVMSSRGCPYACIFCSQRLISGQKYRCLPTERVINKIKLLADTYHQKRIFFVDDTFTMNKKRTFALLDAIIESGYHKKVGFVCESRGKEITWDLLMKMKEANIVSIAFGMETGSERLMATLNKHETVASYVNAVELTHKAGIEADLSLVVGLPTETAEERKLTSKLVRRLPAKGARFNMAIPYPGTKFCEIATKEGRIHIMEDWVNFSNQHYMSSYNIPYTPVGTSIPELVYDTFMANLLFSIRPRTIIDILFGLSSGATVFSVKKKWYTMPYMWMSVFKLMLFLTRKTFTIVSKRVLFSFGLYQGRA